MDQCCHESDTSCRPVALVTGATGVAGRAIVDYLARLDGARVVAVSRDTAPLEEMPPNVTVVSADLLDKENLRDALSLYQISQLFHAAEYREPWPGDSKQKPVNIRATKTMLRIAQPFVPLLTNLGSGIRDRYYASIANAAGLGDPDKKNLTMLRNTVEVLEQSTDRLQHVAVITGGRYYGMHMGPYLYPGWKIPFEEDDPRHPGPSWYFDVEDYVRDRAGRSWTWSIVRPSFLIGFAARAAHNFATSVAVYATILKELGEPLLFPGGDAAYGCLWEASCAMLVAQIMHWSATEPIAANNAFNIVNGEAFRWCSLWPKLAEYFEMDVAVPASGFSVQKLFRDKEPVWQRIVTKHNLQGFRMYELLSPRFLDESMIIDWDVEYSMAKARSMGFHTQVNNTQMFLQFFDYLRGLRIIP